MTRCKGSRATSDKSTLRERPIEYRNRIALSSMHGDKPPKKYAFLTTLEQYVPYLTGQTELVSRAALPQKTRRTASRDERQQGSGQCEVHALVLKATRTLLVLHKTRAREQHTHPWQPHEKASISQRHRQDGANAPCAPLRRIVPREDLLALSFHFARSSTTARSARPQRLLTDRMAARYLLNVRS